MRKILDEISYVLTDRDFLSRPINFYAWNKYEFFM